MAKIINLTPHELIIFNENKEVIETIPSSGVVRVKESNERIGEIPIIIHDYSEHEDYRDEIVSIPIFKKKYLESEGLPDPQPNTYYFVSIIVAQANPNRDDLILSSDLVRDENGRILGCSSFAKL